MALELARQAISVSDEPTRVQIARDAGIGPSLYTMLETGQRALTEASFQKLITAHMGNPIGQAAIRLAYANTANASLRTPVRLAEGGKLTEWEALAFGREVGRLYDRGFSLQATQLAEATRRSIPATIRYSREWLTSDSILTRAYSQRRDYTRARAISNHILTMAKTAGDGQLLVYSLHSLSSTQGRASPSEALSVTMRYYEEILERHISPYLGDDPGRRWARAKNQNLREQLMAIFTALEQVGRNVELLTLMRATWRRVSESYNDIAHVPHWRQATQFCEARVLAYDDPDKALERVEYLALRTEKLSYLISLEVTKYVAFQTLADFTGMRRQAQIIGLLGEIDPSHVRSARLIALAERPITSARNPRQF